MIYITGDTHGDQNRILALEKKSHIKNGDYLIICGDFGYLFMNDLTENNFLDDMSKRGYTILFVDGNHENFKALYEYPVEEFCGGKVHKIRSNIYHLMRGQVYDIDGKSFFTMGGAYSIDRYMRKLGTSYWKEEIPNESEYKEATENLKKRNFNVDYILSHTAPREMIRRLGYYPDARDMQLTGFLEWIMYEAEYKHFYCGHWHEDKDINEKFSFLWFDVKAIK